MPSHDEDFVSRVRGLARTINGSPITDLVLMRLAGDLRSTYPAVQIRQRSSLASLTDDPVYYVYRDGDGRGD